jgi:hypothetical protein
MKREHKWSEDDAIITFYCEKFGLEGLGVNKKELAESIIGTSEASLQMMRGNFRHLIDGSGFEHYSSNQAKVFEDYSRISQKEFKDIVNMLIDKRDLPKNKKEYAKRAKEKRDEQERNIALKKLGKDPGKYKLKIN